MGGGSGMGVLTCCTTTPAVRRHGAFLDLSDEAYLRDVALNQHSVFYGIRAALRVMVPQGRGSIISTSSAAGLGAVPGLGAYGSAKAAVIMLARCAAVEYAHTGVRVNAIAPGSMGTPAFATVARLDARRTSRL